MKNKTEFIKKQAESLKAMTGVAMSEKDCSEFVADLISKFQGDVVIADPSAALIEAFKKLLSEFKYSLENHGSLLGFTSERIAETIRNNSVIRQSEEAIKNAEKSAIKNIVVKNGNFLWLIEEASDVKTAMDAIAIARGTGSVGAEEVHQNAEPPFGDGKVLRFAKVNRIEKVKPS